MEKIRMKRMGSSAADLGIKYTIDEANQVVEWEAATGRVPDYSQHIDTTYALLLRLREAVTKGNTGRAAEIAQAVDWGAVTSEFETVAGRFRTEVYRHARRIIRNLRRPYMLYHDCIELNIQVNLLRGAMKDSPSLLATASEILEQTYQGVLCREASRGHPPQDAPASSPWATVEALFKAADEKMRRGLEMEAAGHPDYLDGRRVV